MRKVALRLAAALAAGLVLVALTPAFAGDAPAGITGKVYGQGVSSAETVPISQLLANPEKWLGKTVRVEGTITGVCEKRGCWITIGSDKEFQDLRIKVDDGVIVFPVEAKGRYAVAEGVFTKIEMSLEQTIRYKKHHAEEHGEEFDPASVTEPLVFYQIKGTGAVIRN
ncbi:MAG: DUF4920 domain-containing protein [Acidobacteriota bacterium]|nr:DUF4920 domain-containing protein [Acidobacteriota bacterium]MDQ7087134.1 DUF4920 domain-containing protein [Acidobacteriota bacterium]